MFDLNTNTFQSDNLIKNLAMTQCYQILISSFFGFSFLSLSVCDKRKKM